jgi:GLPGLI family protein
MKKAAILIIVCSSLIYTLYAQNSHKGKYLKVSYIAVPTSQYQVPPKNSSRYQNYDANEALANSYRYYYTLFINPATQQSIYRLDSFVLTDKPENMKHISYQVNDSLAYVVKYSPSNYIKYESIFQREFYSQGSKDDISWEITDEEKNMYGMRCRKAIPQNKKWLMNVWFTTDVPVSGGPAIFLNLPGLVVRAEDFFWTTEIEHIEYADVSDWDNMIEEYQNKFEQNKKKNFIHERQLLLEKLALEQSMIKMMQD